MHGEVIYSRTVVKIPLRYDVASLIACVSSVAGFPFHELDGVFNWTLSWRRDSEARLYSGTWTRRPRPLTDSELESEYPSWQGKVNFGDYFLDRSRDASEQIAPVVWFRYGASEISRYLDFEALT